MLDPRTGESEVVYRANNAFGSEFSSLLATWVHSPNTPTITHMAVGVGPVPGSYNPSSPPASVAYTQLVSEISRKAITYRSYIDEFGAETVTPEPRVQLTAEFGPDEAVGDIVELGMFGGLNAANPNGGFLTNYKATTVGSIVKASGKTMIIGWRLLFTL